MDRRTIATVFFGVFSNVRALSIMVTIFLLTMNSIHNFIKLPVQGIGQRWGATRAPFG
jgi:hypothetical protein